MIEVRNLVAEYRTPSGVPFQAVKDVSFEVPSGKFFTLLGPSGCGKTTTLRSIAGLELPVSGEIEADGVTVFSSEKGIAIPPNRRTFGMVFQSYAIWPHMTVFSNAAFPLRVGQNRLSGDRLREKVMNVLATVGLDHLADRGATQLSGGQQQRLALARALVMEPRILLLDEPLSNLDARLRDRMRTELQLIQHRLGLTTIYVTHDQSEALALSDKIAVMNEGRIVQMGAPRDVYERPKTRFVADFIGSSNFIEGTVRGLDAATRRWCVETALGPLLVESADPKVVGDRAMIAVRPEHVRLSRDRQDAAGTNRSTGTIRLKTYLGDTIDLELEVAGMSLRSRSHSSFQGQVGDAVSLTLAPENCVVIQND